MKFKTGPRERQGTLDWYVAGLISKGIYELSLSKVISTEVDLCTLESEKFTETLMGISHVFSPECLNNTLLTQGCVLERYASVGTVDRTHILRTGEEGRHHSCPGPAGRLTGGHVFSMISSNNVLLTLPTQQQASGLQNINIATSDGRGFCGIINKWRERDVMFIRLACTLAWSRK